MKKTVLSFFALTIFATLVFGQGQIPNGGFENWNNSSSYADPDNWDTNNEDFNGVPELVTKATSPGDVHSGTAAIRLETKNTTFGDLPGLITLAELDLLNSTVAPTTAFSDRPISLQGWFKYTISSGTDASQVLALFTKWNNNTNMRDTIGNAEWTTNVQTSIYTMFDVPVVWASPNNPDTLIIIAVSSTADNPTLGTVLFLDDLAFNYSPVGVDENESSELLVYPNPAQAQFTVDVNIEETTFMLYDIIGKKVMSKELTKGKNKIDVTALPSGTYIYFVESEAKEALKTGKLIVK